MREVDVASISKGSLIFGRYLERILDINRDMWRSPRGNDPKVSGMITGIVIGRAGAGSDARVCIHWLVAPQWGKVPHGMCYNILFKEDLLRDCWQLN